MTTKQSAGGKDALALLREDHANVKKAFAEFEELGDRAYVGKKRLAEEICKDLELHTRIEEEIFYPAVRRALKDAAPLLDEALVEHGSAKTLIKQIQGMDASAELFDATVKVLSEYIDHHVKEEEQEMFPLVRKTDLDLKVLGEELFARKQKLA
ncbi:hemerythrin domain-containing protein [Kineobactrum salinum]|uniref:Hemerythrin domain-containing protein n=1 Tax=Kineobactrum salinum TaxID=2708301 RepID=A0A6C0U306_9GAMM|nr:hemerythrin domain-containing protein [Kineobactrum salinum]QIB66481.1 hemerythrin domain-containing protein [Kineobactrum salinum]